MAVVLKFKHASESSGKVIKTLLWNCWVLRRSFWFLIAWVWLKNCISNKFPCDVVDAAWEKTIQSFSPTSLIFPSQFPLLVFLLYRHLVLEYRRAPSFFTWWSYQMLPNLMALKTIYARDSKYIFSAQISPLNFRHIYPNTFSTSPFLFLIGFSCFTCLKIELLKLCLQTAHPRDLPVLFDDYSILLMGYFQNLYIIFDFCLLHSQKSDHIWPLTLLLPWSEQSLTSGLLQ